VKPRSSWAPFPTSSTDKHHSNRNTTQITNPRRYSTGYQDTPTTQREAPSKQFRAARRHSDSLNAGFNLTSFYPSFKLHAAHQQSAVCARPQPPLSQIWPSHKVGTRSISPSFAFHYHWLFIITGTVQHISHFIGTLTSLQDRTAQHLRRIIAPHNIFAAASSQRTPFSRILVTNMATGASNIMLRFYNSSGRYTILTGLIGEVQLEAFRKAMADGTLKPFPTLKVKEVLKAVGKTLHEQLKLTPQYRQRVCIM
jgi:hypothetical protein